MLKSLKYVVTRRFEENMPKREDYQILEFELPPLLDQQILIKVQWVSLDPYLRAYNSLYTLPYEQYGYQVGIVQESKNKNYPVGARVVSHHGWCDYYIVNPNVKLSSADFADLDFGVYKLPDLQGLPGSLGLGAVGMPGASAYFGILEICKPKAGETVVITSAAGAVGSIAGQIVKIKGCKVIGFTNSKEKVQWLEKKLGFDKAFNFNTVEVDAALTAAAPNGIDCFFDNVGGEISFNIIKQMNRHGRVAICGNIRVQSDNSVKANSDVFQSINLLKKKQLKVESFLVFRWQDRWPEAFAQLTSWIKSGQIKVWEQVTEGFENIVDAFIDMLSGDDNYGKAVVKIS